LIRTRRNIALFTVFLTFLVFNGSEFLHHHDGTQDDRQCQACLIQAAISSTDVQSSYLVPQFSSYELIAGADNYLLPYLFPAKSYSDRAPPCNS
jgi:hypothetical protein